MMGAVAFLHGFSSYVLFLGSFPYAIGFVRNLAVSKTVHSGAQGPLSYASDQRRVARSIRGAPQRDGAAER